MLPTFTTRQQPLQASCIDYLTIWDPKRTSHQMEDAVTVHTAFLDHRGVMGTLHLQIPPPEALSPRWQDPIGSLFSGTPYRNTLSMNGNPE